ncbi:XdhC family protein [Sphingomonas aliaeris]|uniref:XdhC family protein n=1 Tax=Sphingomonas aliaeris TaxID=2759526 RepID=UPI0021F106B1|nr:XdhC family protein [Sphingomonas aliaeris]
MAVTADALGGTIGGGALEHRVIDQARAILSHPAGAWRVQDYPLGPLLGQCCGGRVRVLVERLATADWIVVAEAGGDIVGELAAGEVRRVAGADGVTPAARGRCRRLGVAMPSRSSGREHHCCCSGRGMSGERLRGLCPACR